MARLFDSTDDLVYYDLSTPTLALANWTACCWLYLESDRNTNSNVLIRFGDGIGTNFSGLAFNIDGTSLLITTQAGDSAGYGLSTGVWYHVAYVKSGTSHTMYVDGVSRATLTQTIGADGTGALFVIGGNGSSHTNGRFAAIKAWSEALTVDQIVNEMRTIRPQYVSSLWGVIPFWDAGTPIDYSGNGRTATINGTQAAAHGPPVSWGGSPIILPYAATARTLDASSGSYAITGAAAQTLVGRVLDASAGSYAITGAAAGTLRGYPLNAASGSYALTGAAATLVATRTLDASAGSYAITGASAGTLRGYPLDASAGSYAVTGAAATTLYGRAVDASAGSYAISGAAATLIGARLLDASAGSYTITGADATLTYTTAGAYTLDAQAGSYAITGAAATLAATRLLDASAGSYAITGAAAGTVAGRALDASSGAYSVTGAAGTLLFGRVVNGQSGAYAITGSDATFTYTQPGVYVLSADAGAYSITGADAGLEYSGGSPQTNNLHPLGPLRYRRPQYVLRIAGRRVVVDDEDEFRRLIDDFEGVAQQRAVAKARAVAAKAPRTAPERVAKSAPKVEVSAGNAAAKADLARLQAQVEQVNAHIAQMYESAVRSELIKAYLAEQDDEEAILMLL